MNHNKIFDTIIITAFISLFCTIILIEYRNNKEDNIYSKGDCVAMIVDSRRGMVIENFGHRHIKLRMAFSDYKPISVDEFEVVPCSAILEEE